MYDKEVKSFDMDMKWNSGSAHINILASSKRGKFGIFNLELVEVARTNETSSAGLYFVFDTSESDLADGWELSGGILAVLFFDDFEGFAGSQLASLACRILDVNAIALGMGVGVSLLNGDTLKAVKSAGSLCFDALL